MEEGRPGFGVAVFAERAERPSANSGQGEDFRSSYSTRPPFLPLSSSLPNATFIAISFLGHLNTTQKNALRQSPVSANSNSINVKPLQDLFTMAAFFMRRLSATYGAEPPFNDLAKNSLPPPALIQDQGRHAASVCSHVHVSQGYLFFFFATTWGLLVSQVRSIEFGSTHTR